MDTVTINKADLLDVLHTNRDKHREVFLAALDRYRETLIAHLESRIADVRAGKQIEHAIRLPIPEDHTADYDRVIRMLEMDVATTVKIEEHDFRRYVMDEWEWSRNFAANTVSYVSS